MNEPDRTGYAVEEVTPELYFVEYSLMTTPNFPVLENEMYILAENIADALLEANRVITSEVEDRNSGEIIEIRSVQLLGDIRNMNLISQEIGKQGGKKTASLYGKKHYSEAGKRGMAKRWGKKD